MSCAIEHDDNKKNDVYCCVSLHSLSHTSHQTHKILDENDIENLFLFLTEHATITKIERKAKKKKADAAVTTAAFLLLLLFPKNCRVVLLSVFTCLRQH
jgi:hypothetical protein